MPNKKQYKCCVCKQDIVEGSITELTVTDAFPAGPDQYIAFHMTKKKMYHSVYVCGDCRNAMFVD